MKTLQIWFGGWAIWREYATAQDAKDGLAFWRKRSSWPLRLV